tara:strand:- start:671 stop:1234 length:564 start_codon:yes stop_codon:yes gene_type:complete
MPKTNRWDCLKPENSSENSGNTNERVNRFKAPSNRAPVNSRWKRSNSPEVRINTFKNRRRGGRGGRGGRFRNNRRGRGGPSIFDNAKRDSSGRPILQGSITQGFDITSAIKNTPNKLSNKERRKQREAQRKKEKEEADAKRIEEEKQAEKELDAIKQEDSEWNKAMMERFMYEEESSSDSELDSDED